MGHAILLDTHKKAILNGNQLYVDDAIMNFAQK